MVSTKESWQEATEGLEEDICESWLKRIQENYSENKRTYHNLDSLREKLQHYQDIKNNLKNPKAVLFALFFQK
jgi:predicted metal-dependent HD superfamily phosphohydrolase